MIRTSFCSLKNKVLFRKNIDIHIQSKCNSWSVPNISSFLSKKTEIETKSNPNNDDNEDELTKIETIKDDKTGKIKYQRNVMGQPTIWDGHIIERLNNPRLNKKGKVHFRDWKVLKEAIFKCPSSKKGYMPMRRELQFIWPRINWAINEHGGYTNVAKKLGLKPHRVRPFYIPYLDESEQYEFMEQQIELYNEARNEQRKVNNNKDE